MKLRFSFFPVRKKLFGNFRTHKPAAAILAVCAIFTPPARADFDINTTFSGVSPGEVVTIYPQGQSSESGWAGIYNFTNTQTNNFGLPTNLQGFCIDIAQDIYANQQVGFNVANLANAPTPGQNMGELRAKLIAELWYNDFKYAGNSNSNAAAFQIAIWEIINETSTDSKGLVLNVGTGTFQVTDVNDSTTLTTANTWLKSLDLSGNGPQQAGLIALTNPTYQDYVVQGPITTPAPSGLILSMVGAVGVVFPMVWRGRKRTSKSA